ncbi:NAD-dependent epimerase/dehydratase family protein [Chthonobacter albigriseus]|uniref:NAD-dependent epimerase/dehydratase family protein n=1 Tax=Chthonobacter albigriseus TaxID=1683161 RepID=UPI0015EF952F|nr:NAD(P)-dependent oxidoreductase [Chthonobacter albigriseus]
MRILVTGATGKVGGALIAALGRLWPDVPVRALCHNRVLPESATLEVIRGSISDRETCRAAVAGVTHVVHMATCKESPSEVMDVAVKGLFWLLEEFRQIPTAERFILIGGDAAVGHFYYRHAVPITEATPHTAYPGCYALSKVLEEVLVAQCGIQYGLDWCCLRAPWIMEKDDFRYTLSFGDDLFGGPDWKTMVTPEVLAESRRKGAVPLLVETDGTPVRRNFVHVDDLVSAILAALTSKAARQKLYNVAMDEPVDYALVARYLAETRGIPATVVKGPFFGNWMDNTRAKAELGWRPVYDAKKLIDSAWDHIRTPEDPRKVWYPG